MLALGATTTVALAFALRRVRTCDSRWPGRTIYEEALMQSEARARLLFDKAPQPMMVFDEDTGRFLAANDAASARYGYTREEFLQLTVYDIRPAGGPGPHRARAGTGCGECRWRRRARTGTMTRSGRAHRRRHHVTCHQV